MASKDDEYDYLFKSKFSISHSSLRMNFFQYYPTNLISVSTFK